jgi:capsule biosynthesis phosphatase
VIDQIRAYRAIGFRIILQTARGMRSKANNVGRIIAEVLPDLQGWLIRYEIPFDEIHVGKPWPGPLGFVVDDRAVRPLEFVSRTHAEILELLGKDDLAT